MNREIKFRAWDKKNKVMDEVDGYHLYIADGELWEVYENSFGYMERNKVTDDYELMQYTGLKDKDGVEIYEGDIFNRNEHFGQVQWGIDGWIIVFDDGKRLDFSFDNTYDWNVDQKEVIGNIYQNPGLLNK